MKITIIGNCGSGKSTLAKEISKKLNIPYIQLDRFWFEAGGHKLKGNNIEEKEKVRAYIKSKVEEFVNIGSWVSDGWYSRSQPLIAEKADQIVFLDIPLWKRLVNHLRRVFNTDRHPELSRWEDFIFTFEMIKRTFTHDPAIRKFVGQQGNKVTILKSYPEKEKYLESL